MAFPATTKNLIPLRKITKEINLKHVPSINLNCTLEKQKTLYNFFLDRKKF